MLGYKNWDVGMLGSGEWGDAGIGEQGAEVMLDRKLGRGIRICWDDHKAMGH